MPQEVVWNGDLAALAAVGRTSQAVSGGGRGAVVANSVW